MISIYNKAIVKELNPYLWEQLENISEEDINRVKIVSSISGEPTMVYQKEGEDFYLHSRYQPSYEAQKLIDSCEDIKDGDNIIFFGIGLGYHVKEVLRRFPNVRYTIVEPELGVLHGFLEKYELKDMGVKNLVGICNDLEQMELIIPEMFAQYPGESRIVWVKNYETFFKDKFSEFRRLLPQILRKERDRSLFYEFAQIRLVENEIENMRDVLQDKELVDCNLSVLKGKTAILVAAGPSLDDEIENLKKIKERGMAYIFPVGSAVNTLLFHGIHGDAVFSYDPSEKNQKVLQKIKDEKITDIPMIYGTIIGYETLQNYPSPKMKVFGASSYISNYFLKYKDKNREKVIFQEGATISVMALDALIKMGFENIIFVGQNLGIVEDRKYSSGVEYIDSHIKDESDYMERERDVHGNWMRTSTVYLHMKNGLEKVIELSEQKAKIWNATKFGMHIEGSSFKELSELMKDMKEGDVTKDWLECEVDSEYDLEHMEEQLESIKLAKSDIKTQVKKMDEHLKDIKKNGELGIFKKLLPIYKKLNLNLTRIEDNSYGSLFVLPTMIKQYQNLIKRIDYFNSIPEQENQYKIIYEEFRKFLTSYEQRMESMEKKSDKLIRTLEEYIMEKKEIDQ